MINIAELIWMREREREEGREGGRERGRNDPPLLVTMVSRIFALSSFFFFVNDWEINMERIDTY